MNILYVTSEATPFIKTGGLADVAGSLPKMIKSKGEDIRVVLPLYSQISHEFREKMRFVGYYFVDLAWMHKYCGVFELEHDEVTYYFLDNEDYFKRDKLYGEFDDAERFIFFSKAVVVLPKYLDFKCDVIHSNDWHSGLVSTYVNEFRKGDDFYLNTKTLFTIHNIKYQGQFDKAVFTLTGLPENLLTYSDLEHNGAFNFMKAGIVHSTKFNTVSSSYALEITFPFFAEGLENVINHHSYKLSGIVNGLDYDVWNPETDKNIAMNFTKRSKGRKKHSKKEVQKLFNLPQREDVCMISMVTRLTEMKGFELIRYIFEELIQQDIQFVILGTGDKEYEDMFKYFEHKYPEKVAARLYFNSKEANLIYAASDLYLMPSISEPCGISQLIALRYGTLPIVRETGGLRDTVAPFNKYTLEGTGFSFANVNAHELLFKTKEAIDLYYEDKKSFNKIISNAMSQNFDWDNSSKEYIALYRSL